MSRENTIGFIGTGVMGRSMASHLMEAGYGLRVFNRTRGKAEPLIRAGAVWCPDPATLVEGCGTVVTIVGYPGDVEALYFGPDGLLEQAEPGTLLIDMTTSRPDLAVRINRHAEERGCLAMDAPVSGGDLGAREARLSIMAGGSESAFERALPLFKNMGRTLVLQGPAGSGQHCKMANQIAIASGMLGVCESMAYARAAGLDPFAVLKSIEPGAASSWSLSNLAPRMLKGDFAPGFYVKHFLKDLGIALESARALGLELPGLVLAEQLYQELSARGHADAGTQALFQLYSGRG